MRRQTTIQRNMVVHSSPCRTSPIFVTPSSRFAKKYRETRPDTTEKTTTKICCCFCEQGVQCTLIDVQASQVTVLFFHVLHVPYMLAGNLRKARQ